MFRKMMAVLAMTALFSAAACTGNGVTEPEKSDQAEGGFRGTDPPRSGEVID